MAVPVEQSSEHHHTGEENYVGLCIRNYTPIGTVSGFGKLIIYAYEIVLLGAGHSQMFIKIGVEGGGQYPQSSAALIKYENIEKLTDMIGRLSEINSINKRFKFMELEYSIDNFKIVVFNSESGKMMFSASCDGVTASFGDLLRLDDLKAFIRRAKVELDRNRRDA